jgi:type II secretion system protein G
VLICQRGGERRKEKAVKRFSKGVTLIELLIGIAILVILAGIAVANIGGLLQRTKVQAAKSTMKGIALALDMVKTDTGLYPAIVDDIKEASSPSGISSSYWRGPYAETISLDDPWGNEYQYELIIFGPETIEREMGGPSPKTFTFTATAGPGTLIIDNPGVTSGSVILNGEEIVTEDEFKHIIPVIIKRVVLSAANTITIDLGSKPGTTITIKISAKTLVKKDATFVLWSWGRDGSEGGEKYDADIVYGQY